MTPLKCTVAVKGMTVFKEVHTKGVKKGLRESAQREKKQENVHMQVKSYVATVCTNRKS